MCEFHEYKGNGFGDNWLTGKLIYFSGTDSAGGITRGMDEMRQLDTAISASVRAFVRACACVRVCMLCTYYNIAKYVGHTFMLLLGGVGENQRSRMRHQVLHKDKRFYGPCGVLHCVQLRSCVSVFPLVILTLLRLSSMSAYILRCCIAGHSGLCHGKSGRCPLLSMQALSGTFTIRCWLTNEPCPLGYRSSLALVMYTLGCVLISAGICELSLEAIINEQLFLHRILLNIGYRTTAGIALYGSER